MAPRTRRAQEWLAVGVVVAYRGDAVGKPGSDGKTTIKTPWEARIIPNPGASASATATAEDGHELTADLLGRGHLEGEPHKLKVTAHAKDEADGGPVTRYPTFPEVLDAGDLLAPGDVFSIIFVCAPAGIERVPDEPGADLGIEGEQVGAAKTSPLILS